MHPRYWAIHAAFRLKAPFSAAARRRRLAEFRTRLHLAGGERVIDLGGVPRFWAPLEVPLDITVLNLPGGHDVAGAPPHHRFRFLDGDATATGLPDGSFDIAFSNSVIEHVGGPDRQRAFAAEARRLAPAYWVQTPSIWFPIEAHTHMPFWWFYPAALRRWFLRRWEAKLPAWCEMVKGTTVITRDELAAMFPDGAIWTERFAGLPKSYVAWRAKAAATASAAAARP